jgi:hypothetical protein
MFEVWKTITRGSSSNVFPRMCEYGTTLLSTGYGKIEYIVVERLGPDISALLRKFDGLKDSRNRGLVGLQFGIAALSSLEALHKIGYVHRGFLTSPCHPRLWLTDFGLTRQVDQSVRAGELIGTSRYAGLAAHEHRPQTFCDDILSLMFVMLHVMYGGLPWTTWDTHSEQKIERTAYHSRAMLAGTWDDKMSHLARWRLKQRLKSPSPSRVVRCFKEHFSFDDKNQGFNAHHYENLRADLERSRPASANQLSLAALTASSSDAIHGEKVNPSAGNRSVADALSTSASMTSAPMTKPVSHAHVE